MRCVPQRVRRPDPLQVRRREPLLADQRLVERAKVGCLAGAYRRRQRLRRGEHRAEVVLEEGVALREELLEARVVGGALGDGRKKRKRKRRSKKLGVEVKEK